MLYRDDIDGIMHYSINVVIDMRSINGFSSIVCEKCYRYRPHRPLCKSRPPRYTDRLRCNRKQTNKMAASVEELPVPRFTVISDEDIEEFIGSTDSENTKKQIKYGLSIFKEFCSLADVDFEDLANTDIGDLDKLLSRFYAGARTKKGDVYSAKSMHCIKFALQRHFLSIKSVDIKGKDFPLSNRVFKATIVKLKASGKGCVKHHPSISDADMTVIQDSFDLSKPRDLQRKVFIDCMIYFANRGMENLRNMKPEDFILHEQGEKDFFTLRDMITKNHQDDDGESQGGQMHSVAGSSRCPVKNLKKYLRKLNPMCEYMWQRPKVQVSDADDVWFDNAPVGKNTLESMTKKICEDAGCSKKYTNHSLRATSITILDHAGYASRHIMTVSGHRSETSIKNYSRTSEQQKVDMSKTLSAKLHATDTDSDTVENTQLDQPSTSASGLADVVDDSVGDGEAMTDSQLERVFSNIPDAYPFEDITNIQTQAPAYLRPQVQVTAPSASNVTHASNVSMNLVNAQSRPHIFHFHSGCVVHMYNK